MLLRAIDLYIRVWSSLTPLGRSVRSPLRPVLLVLPVRGAASRALAIGALRSALRGPLGVGDLLSMAVPPVFFGPARRS